MQDVRAYTFGRMRGLLLINPRSGTESPTAVELQDEALARGVHAQVLERGEDPAEPARTADTEILGAAGGDGSAAPVAGVAVARGLPFVCVPYGRATTSRATSGSTVTIPSRRSTPSGARSARSTSGASADGAS